jgi:hypothetical protein
MLDIKSMYNYIRQTEILVLKQNWYILMNHLFINKWIYHKLNFSHLFTLIFKVCMVFGVFLVRVKKPQPNFHYQRCLALLKGIDLYAKMTQIVDFNLLFEIFEVEGL